MLSRFQLPYGPPPFPSNITMKNILLLALLLCGTWLHAQTFSISGKIADTHGLTMPGATITLQKADSTIAKSAITDANGAFVLNEVAAGSYLLKASLLGSEDLQKQLVLRDQNLELGTLILHDSQLLQDSKCFSCCFSYPRY